MKRTVHGMAESLHCLFQAVFLLIHSPEANDGVRFVFGKTNRAALWVLPRSRRHAAAPQALLGAATGVLSGLVLHPLSIQEKRLGDGMERDLGGMKRMAVFQKSIRISTKGRCDVLDITEKVAGIVAAEAVKSYYKVRFVLSAEAASR